MIRMLYTVALWMLVIGGLWYFVDYRARSTAATAARIVPVDVARVDIPLVIELTPTFAMQPDPFAVRTADTNGSAALLVRLNGTEVLREADSIQKGVSHTCEATGFKVGLNELFVEANPPLDIANQAHALRVRVLHDTAVLAEHTFWTDPHNRVSNAFSFNVTKQLLAETGGAHDH